MATLSTSIYGSVLPYTILQVNAPIYGSNGLNADVRQTWSYECEEYSKSTSGQSAINFNGFSGKTVKIINNSTIKGGSGGSGISCGAYKPVPFSAIYCTAKISYGSTAMSVFANLGGVNIDIIGNSPTNGSNGNNATYYTSCQDHNAG